MKKNKVFDKAFKEHAVNLWVGSGKSATEVAQELGIKPQRLYAWKELSSTPAQSNGSPAAKGRSVRDLELQLAQLQRENQMLRQQRDILKKTLGILSEPPSNASSAS